MVVVRLTLLVCLACVLGCALGPEGHDPSTGPSPEPPPLGPPEIVRRDPGRLDAGPPEALTDAGEAEAADLPDAVDPLADSGLEPVFSSQEPDELLLGLDAGPLDAGPGDPIPPVLCRPGTYGGVFAGELRAVLGVARTDVQGTLRFELPNAAGGKLSLARGALEGRDTAGHPFRATLSGTLNCITGQLEGGRLRGSYTRPDPTRAGRTLSAPFAGVVAGSFGGDPLAAQGSWAIETQRDAQRGGGSGSWSGYLSGGP